MKGSTTGTTLQPNRGGVVQIDTEQGCKKRWIAENGLAHNEQVF
jgi:hypothetical protein